MNKLLMTFSRFDTIPACDGPTDRRTDREIDDVERIIRCGMCVQKSVDGSNFCSLLPVPGYGKLCSLRRSQTISAVSSETPSLLAGSRPSVWSDQWRRVVVHVKPNENVFVKVMQPLVLAVRR